MSLSNMIKELVEPKDLLLNYQVKSCSYNLNRPHLASILKENMFHYNGIGLSANQIGIWERAFIMMIDIEKKKTITCFNPIINKSYGDPVFCEEGCLSYPDQTVNVKRPDRIVVTYEDETKMKIKLKLTGITARIFQHEYDHLEGIDFMGRNENE